MIGAGWIGSEVAASARQLGRDVAMVDPGTVPLQRVLGTEVGAVYRDLHADHGVDLHLATGVDVAARRRRVEEVRLTDGTRLPPTSSSSASGPHPASSWPPPLVWRSTTASSSTPTCAPACGRLRRRRRRRGLPPRARRPIRVEHWANALHQGPAAARNMLGIPTPTTGCRTSSPTSTSSAWSTPATRRRWDRVVFRGDPADGAFIAFWLADGVVVAGMNANVWDVTDPIQQPHPRSGRRGPRPPRRSRRATLHACRLARSPLRVCRSGRTRPGSGRSPSPLRGGRSDAPSRRRRG